MYNHIGLGGVLLIDVSTYVVSFLCYFAVRKGRHVVLRPEELRADLLAAENQLQRFWREMREGLHFLRDHRAVVLLGISWALFLGAMITGVVVTPSLSERVFHAGAVGYGWLNAGWGTGAFLSALYAPAVIASLGGRRSVAFSMALLAACVVCAPVSHWLVAGHLLYGVMGSARGVGGIAMNTSLMEMVPQHLMGRVQNAFYFFGTFLQLVLASPSAQSRTKSAWSPRSRSWPAFMDWRLWPRVGRWELLRSGSHCSGMKSITTVTHATSSRSRVLARGLQHCASPVSLGPPCGKSTPPLLFFPLPRSTHVLRPAGP